MGFVVQWPGSYCRASADGCCLPTTGEPELDFFVKGLYPADSSGTLLTKCNNTKFFVNAVNLNFFVFSKKNSNRNQDI